MPVSDQGEDVPVELRTARSRSIVGGTARGHVLFTDEALSFWGGIDPATGSVIDVRHPLHGACVSGRILAMPSSRGSCTGSGVLLDLILSGRAPAALVFSEPEDVLTLGALVALELFDRRLPVLRLSPDDFAAASRAREAEIGHDGVAFDGTVLPLGPPDESRLDLTEADHAMLDGREGDAVRRAMRIICAVAAQQGAIGLVDVVQGHIDGCIYASPANLVFAERLAGLGAAVRVPTTMNAISVDYAHWRAQGIPDDFGRPAQRLADAYVGMGCRPTFTCAPYLLESAPRADEMVAWSESNAVIYANTVLAARTAKHPDFLDLCIAMTGRAPLSGVYLDEPRRPRRVIDVEVPSAHDDALWPLVGYLAGRAAPDRIPLLRGLAALSPSPDDLKALCAAFGTTSAAPMLHVEGVTPEAALAPAADADRTSISVSDLSEGWRSLNDGPGEIDLVAIGSPHASLAECRAVAAALAGRTKHPEVSVIVTAGRQVVAAARDEGTLAALERSGVQVVPDLCWCSITEPLFPERARAVLTNSGKYAHYGPGLSGRRVRLGSLSDCVAAALDGRSEPRRLPA